MSNQPASEPLGAGSSGTEGFWADIDRSYNTENRQHDRASRRNCRNMSFASQQFQSSAMGLMLTGGMTQPPSVEDPT